jgi:hypothetical protein
MVRFFYIDLADSLAPVAPALVCDYRDGRKIETLRLAPGAFSALVSYDGPREFGLQRQPPATPPAPPPPPEEVARFTLPPAWQGALILVRHDPANPKFPFRFYPVEYWAPAPPIREIRILNLCPFSLAAKIGQSMTQVSPGDLFDAPLPAQADQFGIKLALQRRDTWQRILSTALPAPSGTRFLVLVYPDSLDGESIRTLMLDDLPGPPPPPL